MESVLARSPVPRYVQIADLFRQRIARGGWCAGTRVPSNEELMREFDVSRITIRQAVDVLARDGLLEARQGSGTFVTGEVRDDRWLRVDEPYRPCGGLPRYKARAPESCRGNGR